MAETKPNLIDEDHFISCISFNSSWIHILYSFGDFFLLAFLLPHSYFIVSCGVIVLGPNDGSIWFSVYKAWKILSHPQNYWQLLFQTGVSYAIRWCWFQCQYFIQSFSPNSYAHFVVVFFVQSRMPFGLPRTSAKQYAIRIWNVEDRRDLLCSLTPTYSIDWNVSRLQVPTWILAHWSQLIIMKHKEYLWFTDSFGQQRNTTNCRLFDARLIPRNP